MKGVIKLWKLHNGYGFIKTETGPDIFVHERNLCNLEPFLAKGDIVEFEVMETSKGLSAVNVKKLSSATLNIDDFR